MDDRIISEVLNKIMPHTIVNAIKGLDKHSREKMIEHLSFKRAEKVRGLLQYWEAQEICPYRLYEVKEARQKIVNRMNIVARKIEKGEYPVGAEILKD
jgi:flagellar motor switch protein FliG